MSPLTHPTRIRVENKNFFKNRVKDLIDSLIQNSILYCRFVNNAWLGVTYCESPVTFRSPGAIKQFLSLRLKMLSSKFREKLITSAFLFFPFLNVRQALNKFSTEVIWSKTLQLKPPPRRNFYSSDYLPYQRIIQRNLHDWLKIIKTRQAGNQCRGWKVMPGDTSAEH